MKFDYTHGKPAKYMVSRYGWNTSDQYYANSMEQAKAIFTQLKETVNEGAISIYDLKTDTRKAFVRL